MTIDAVVAGAGIWWCTVVRWLVEAGHKVLVFENRLVAKEIFDALVLVTMDKTYIPKDKVGFYHMLPNSRAYASITLRKNL